MILLPKFCNKDFYNFVLSKNVVHFGGYNVASFDFKYMSKSIPYMGSSIRFLKLNQHTFYECTKEDYEEWTYRGLPQLLFPVRWIRNPEAQLYRLENLFTHNDLNVREPVYLHTKPLIMKEGTLKDKSSHTVGAYYKDTAEIGDEIKEDIPDFVFKLPEDYL
jgi:hypothetical protein